jgi:protein O-GlcNAc transferase
MNSREQIQGAVEHQKAGRWSAAEAIYRQLLQRDPNDFAALFMLGGMYIQSGHFDAAIGTLQRAIQLQPGFADAHYNIGIAFQSAKQFDFAVVAFSQTVRLNPKNSSAFNNLGVVLCELARFDEGIAAYRQAIQLRPDYADAHYNLGLAFRNSGKPREAAERFRAALQLRPEFAQAYCDLGNALLDQDEMPQAIIAYREAIARAPANADAHYNLGIALNRDGRREQALAAFQQALRLRPEHPETFNNLGNVYKEIGQLDAALDAYRHAVELNPTFVHAQGNLAFALTYHPDADAATIQQELQRLNAMQHHARLAPRGSVKRDPSRRLRIGYVSPDFRRHVVGHNLLPLLAHHNHQRFEIFCYANLSRADDLTDRFRSYADHWRDIVRLSDDQAAALIQQDEIDILVDLALHTRGHRLGIFARKPAPIQATFAGYPGSTGLATIDYRLTDPYLDPPHLDDAHYAETSLRLAHTFWCYEPQYPELAVAPLPAASAGHITFGCLNNFCKINEPTLHLWARVLNAVPEAQFLLMAHSDTGREWAMRILTGDGIAPARITFVPKQQQVDYLRTYDRIDVGLDTLPYNGHTTSLDALWMGVPVLTLVGKTVVGRAGASQLTNLGLPEFITRTPEEFVARAVAIARDIPALATLRQSLRDRVQASALMDARGFARDIEEAYRTMWTRFADGMQDHGKTF